MISPAGPMDIDQLGRALAPAVLEAGRILMAHFHAGVTIEKKADRSPVSIADRDAEGAILTALARIAPAIPVVAEEAVAAGQIPPPADRFFLVDALDGTRHFVRGSPEFSINVALIDHGRAVFGLIYGPPTSRLFLTRAGGAAFEIQAKPDQAGIELNSFALKKLVTRTPDRENLRAFNSSLSTRSDSGMLLNSLKVRVVQPLGSAMKFCLIAAGEGDLYVRLGETCEWDTAAGQAILEGAGGAVTGLDGNPLTYGHASRGYLNPHFVAWGRRPHQADVRAMIAHGRNA